MKFCPKCSSLMLPKKDAKKKAFWYCNSCGHGDKKSEVDAKLTTKIDHGADLQVVDESAEDSTMPTCEAECEKCGHGVSYYWSQQTRSSDEPETRFLKCVNCKHTRREYQ